MAKHFSDFDLHQQDQETDDNVDLNAAEKLARQKDDIAHKVANAAEEIERLRMRQEELEYAKRTLQELNQKQDSYTQQKKEMISLLGRSIVQMEKDEIRAARLVQLLSGTREQFKGLLSEIREIREEQWEESVFEENLDQSLALLENARMVYNKSVAKVDAEQLPRGDRGATGLSGTRDNPVHHPFAGRGFFFWLKIGFALALPVTLLLTALGFLLLWYTGWH